MKKIAFILSLAALQFTVSYAQKPPVPKPEALADQWFTRLNELDDWYISFEGEEENREFVDRFVDLYADDAYHQIGPNENQIGQVVLHGKESIRKWADEFSKKYVNVNYRVEYKTGKEKTLQAFYTIQMPWGGTGASTEFMALYRDRQDRRMWAMPGAVFFLFDEAGKIQNVRIYLLELGG
jgi:hypothetical protein